MPATPPHDTIMRAKELASSGANHVDDIRKQLLREGYDQVDGHLSGLSIKTQLKRLIAERRG